MLDSHAREYILQPSSGRVDVALGAAPWQPQATVRGEIKDIAVSLASAQYEDYMRVLRRLAQTAVRTETARNVAAPRYLGYRPAVGALVQPRAWWLYLLQAHTDAEAYTTLWIKSLCLKRLSNLTLSMPELTEIRMLELRLQVWQVMRCRATAEAKAGDMSTDGMKVHRDHDDEVRMYSEQMNAPAQLSAEELPADYCSVDVELRVTGMTVALSLTDDKAKKDGSSSNSKPKESDGTGDDKRSNRRKRRSAAHGLV